MCGPGPQRSFGMLQRGPVERPGGKTEEDDRRRDRSPLQRGPVERPGGKPRAARSRIRGCRFNGARSKDREESRQDRVDRHNRYPLQRGPVERPGGKGVCCYAVSE